MLQGTRGEKEICKVHALAQESQVLCAVKLGEKEAGNQYIKTGTQEPCHRGQSVHVVLPRFIFLKKAALTVIYLTYVQFHFMKKASKVMIL